MISERVLRKWRGEALEVREQVTITDPIKKAMDSLAKHVLHMTQELLDQHLLNKVIRK